MSSAICFTPFGAGARAAPRHAFRPRMSAQRDNGSVDVQADRRTVVLTGVLGGVASIAARPPPAPAAEAVCSEFTTAANGIQWCDTKKGEGRSPNKGELIRCHYTGRLTSNGRVFDSSYERRRPLTFKVGVREVIAGWDAAIAGDGDLPPMQEGGKRRVIIPAELGYGARGAGGVIPPNASLTFDIELLGRR